MLRLAVLLRGLLLPAVLVRLPVSRLQLWWRRPDICSDICLILVVLRRRSLLALGRRLLLVRLLLLIVLLLLMLLIWVLSSTMVGRLLLIGRLLVSWRVLNCVVLPVLLWRLVSCMLPSTRVARLACDVERQRGGSVRKYCQVRLKSL